MGRPIKRSATARLIDKLNEAGWSNRDISEEIGIRADTLSRFKREVLTSRPVVLYALKRLWANVRKRSEIPNPPIDPLF